MRPFILFGMIIIFLVSCDREDKFTAILSEGSAPTEVQANIQFNNMEPPFSVTVTPTAIGATAFEVLSGIAGEAATLIGLGQEVTFSYPEADENFFVTIRAIAPNDLVTEEQFEVVPPSDPCTQIFSAPVTWDNGDDGAFFFGFNGVELQVVENPDPSGANAEASNVLEIVQDGGGNFDGFGVQMTGPASFTAEDKVVRLSFWSDIELPVRLAVQQDPNNQTEREVEVSLIHTGTGWEELRFDFANATAGFTGNPDGALGIPDGTSLVPTGEYIRFQMFISPGDDVAGTFYLDNAGICPDGGAAPPEDNSPVPPSNVMADIQFNTMEAPFSVTITPTATGATSFEVTSGIPGDMAIPVPLDGDITFDYPESDTSFFATVNALGENDTSTEMQFEIIPPVVDPGTCTPIIEPISMENGETFSSFGIASTQVITNPDLSGVNTEATNVLEVVGGGAAFQAIQYFPAEPADFSGDDKMIRMKVWSQVAVDIRFNFTQGLNGALGVEVLASHTGSGWEELVLDFANATRAFDSDPGGGDPLAPSGQYNEIQIFFAPGGSSTDTFYVDDITGGCETEDMPPMDEPCVPIFDTISLENGENFSSFGIASTQVITNPDLSGVNTEASNVLEVVGGGAAFQAIQYFPAQPADFSGADKMIRMKVWSQVAVDIRYNLTQGLNGALGVEVLASHTGSGWEEIVFDFANATRAFDADPGGGDPLAPSGAYNEFQIFFAPGGTSTDTFYVDDIAGGCTE